jgi:Contractile injection system tube protein
MSEIEGMYGKGALLIQDPADPNPKIIKFQYNPESLTRSFQPIKSNTGTEENDPSETFRITNPPIETLSLDIEIDATDKLEFPDKNSNTVKMGINPELAALESLLYPKSSDIINSNILASLGTIEIVPPEGPSLFLVWGSNRIVPVSITDFRIVEEAHDFDLNPLRAKVSLTLKILTYDDLFPDHPAYAIYQTYHKNKETIASY